MPDPSDLPERRIKNVWASAIAVAGLIIGIILIVRGNPSADAPQVSRSEPLRGILVIVISFVIAAIVYALNNRHHIKAKSDHDESKEFDS
jgi:hypothetical protein